MIDPLGANPETRTATSVGTSGSGGTGVSFATPLAFAHASGIRVDLFAHRLTDTLQWNWNNTCISDPDGDCTTNDQIATAGASTIVSKLDSSTLTAIHNASHTVVTAAAAGVVVHDFITVNGQPGSPVPSGTVSLAWFTNGTCAGSAASSKNETLTGNGTVDATDFPQGPLAAGKYSFQATYLGDATYNGSTGACEPLTVVDANIQIAPTATNRVGFPHTFTAHVNVNDGTGFANAPNGTVINFSVAAGGVGTLSSSFCTTSGGTGSCSVTDNSSTPGKDVVTASTSLVVATVSLTRSTDGVGLNSGPATKTWVDARIHISPSATNRVGFPHTFVAHVEKNLGDGNGWVDAAGVAVQITVANSLGGSANPAGPFNALTNAQGLTFATFTSPTPGKLTGHAVSSLNLGSQQDPIFIQTDGQGQNGSDAVKTFVDARIHITPSATNRVGFPHTFTAHVEKNLGDGNGWVDAAGVARADPADEQPWWVGEPAGSVQRFDERAGVDLRDVHVEHAWEGDRSCGELAEPGLAAGSGLHPDRRPGPERLGRGEDVRRRADPPLAVRRRTRSVSRIRSRRTSRRTSVTATVGSTRLVSPCRSRWRTLRCCGDAGGPVQRFDERERLDHGDVHVEHGRDGDRSCGELAEPGFAAGSDLHPDRRSGPERLGRGEDVRRREHRVESVDGDE